MRKLLLYTGNKTFMFPTGKLATPEVMQEHYPAIATFKHVIETDENEEVILSLSNLSVMRSQYSIDATLTDEEAVTALNEAINATQEVATVEATTPVQSSVSPMERIAAALEYQNLMSMEDAE